MRSEFLPFSVPTIGEDDIDAVVRILRSGWLTTGPESHAFEKAFAEYVGASHAIAVNSGTAALHLALDAIGLKAGDEVIVPTMTFAATAEVVLYFHARPVLVDSSPDTLNISPEAIERAITPRTRAIIPVHLGGHPADMDPILAVAKKHNLRVIEDAAHTLPARYRGRMVGKLADIACFSFYSTKTITTGEGGMITTEDAALADRMRIMSLHGISRNAWKRYTAQGSWYYEILFPGYKYNMTDVAAALGRSQLCKADAFLQRRTAQAEYYDRALSDLPEVKRIACRADVQHSWHLYIVRLDTDRLKITRDEMIDELKRRNIGCSVHFIPLHLHPYYREAFGYAPNDLPVAKAAYERAISIPLYPRMTEGDQRDVVDALREVVSANRK